MKEKITLAKEMSMALGIYSEWNTTSEYLMDELKEMGLYVLAQCITWLRHSVPSYNRCWGRGGYGWNKLSEYTHSQAKYTANKVALKKIMKLGLIRLNDFGITKDTFTKLDNWDYYYSYPDLKKMYERL